MNDTYWNDSGKYQAEYTSLCETLIPDSGKCDTVAGEMLRSATRLAYDFYNNGMGNNTSGAVNYLLKKGVVDVKTYGTIYEYTRGMIYGGGYNGDALQLAIERMIDITVEYIQSNPELKTLSNTEDMFDFEEPFQEFCEECGDEIDGRGFYGSVCSYCESQWEDEDEDEE